MRKETARFILFIAWGGVFTVFIVSIFRNTYPAPEVMLKGMEGISGLYLPFLTTIMAFWFIRRGVCPATATIPISVFLIAAIGSAVFNGVMLYVFFFSLDQLKSIPEIMPNMTRIASYLSVFVGFPVGYFFALN